MKNVLETPVTFLLLDHHPDLFHRPMRCSSIFSAHIRAPVRNWFLVNPHHKSYHNLAQGLTDRRFYTWYGIAFCIAYSFLSKKFKCILHDETRKRNRKSGFNVNISFLFVCPRTSNIDSCFLFPVIQSNHPFNETLSHKVLSLSYLPSTKSDSFLSLAIVPLILISLSLFHSPRL